MKQKMTVEKFKTLVRGLCRQVEQGKFTPILEADINSWLYHSMITKGFCSLSEIHSDTRVIQAKNKNEHFDLAIGDLEEREGDSRPAIRPRAVIEIKVFPVGFRSGQYARRLKEILNRDLPKLGSLGIRSATMIEFIYDEIDYLSGKSNNQVRADILVSARNRKARGAKLVFARKDKTTRKWQVYVA